MSHEHFKGQFEVELKYRLASKPAFLAVLNSIVHQVMFEDNIESDSYFDTKEQTLLSQNKSVCIRECEPAGIKLWIVKGPEADRCEATNITDANNARSMLKNMGYEVSLEMKKQRSIYFVGKFHITVDHLAGLGDFAEFAIMTDDETMLDAYRTELVSLAAQFGLSEKQLEHRSYRSLQAAK
ncbi:MULTISPECIES: class IV adenylate cyclase [unclassified Shewanella]|uniref:class IV adenylate cyclase n=1 Tax=unclassified Shewanella TaxID=196818 RepID=UPI001BBD247C|nr:MULTISPECIES: class IV adenylate cyclase [unclassified Shewanella]GIU12225.1 adenylate cyclase [Shewanella sp. MBTL60-112-B1]GIU31597.1 adenylate cyclase [Shewanella sp. MBTL60-112-B2]